MERDRTTLDYVGECCDSKGFPFAFTDYSDFLEVKDEEFHRLRIAYLEAGKALAAYLGVEVGG